MSQTAPYGKWESTITPECVVESSIRFADIFVDPRTNKVYHIESRPTDDARSVIVDTFTDQDVIPSPYSAGTSVHEYGGAAAIAYGGTVYFSNAADNRVYSTRGLTQTPEAVTPDKKEYRYANLAVHPICHNLLVSVLEDHTVDSPQTVVTTLVVINTTRKAVFPLVVGADFYAAPVFNPPGTKIAWQEWYHPDMPWEGSLIKVADVLVQADTIVVLNTTHVGGERLTKSVTYPLWASETTLVFTSDEVNGFQNPFIYSTQTGSAKLAIPAPIKEDFGAPLWSLGDYPYALLDDPKGGTNKFAAFTAFRDGRSILYTISLSDEKRIVQISNFPFSLVKRVNQSGGTSIVFNAKKSDAPGGIFMATFNDTLLVPSYRALKSSDPQPVLGKDEYISPPRPITLCRGNEPLYVVYYAPLNPKYSGSSIPGEKPPCIVDAHGGPTGIEAQILSWEKLYYTSRGYAWLDVNYGGSSGHGREYISRLAGKWGIVDVQDCQDAARLIATEHCLIDGSRVAIQGGSAGGFTTLAAISIAPNPGFFKASTSHYGISDLERLYKSTHKFESRYIEKLMGGTPQDIPEVYRARSPLYHAHRIVTPLLVLQGEEDRVVPPDQSERIVKTIIKHGGEDRVKYRLFKGEGHGFQCAETIKEAVALEHDWYDAKLL